MIYLILVVISFLLTYLIKEYAIKKSLIARVNERSSHTIPTPHGGGIAIVITWAIGLIYLYMTSAIDSSLFSALSMGIIISIVSFFDDLYELSSKLRLIIQSLVALGALFILGGLESITFGIFEVTNVIITNLFAFLLIVWFINLTNFIDGINGYVGSELVYLGCVGFILFGESHFIILAVSVLGFLYWNWNNAKIFMGDVGSTLLGYNIAIFTLYYANQEATNLWIWITLFSLFWFDATITLIRRKLNGEKATQAHKKHAYQRLTQAGWSHFKVTNYAIRLNMVLFALVYLIENVFIAFVLSLMLLYICMKYVDSQKEFN
ncbi:MraY family glycosyltransferase [Arcobacter sp.]|uniref:MraY family glycosyltransferase n=1 Tax=Arcobacter sp. TaxID=1872629 RepID=UPI003D0ABACE